MSEVKNIPAELIGLARRRGAVAAEALVGRSTQLTWKSGPGRPDRNEASLVALRVYLEGGALGEATRGDLHRDSFPALLDEAMEAARRAPPDPVQGPVHRLDIATRGLGISDPRQPNLTDEDREEVLRWNEEGAREAAPGAVHCHFTYRERVEQRAYANSRSVEAFEASTRFGLVGQLSGVGEGAHSVEGENASRTFADIGSRPLGVDLGRQLAAMERRAGLPAGKAPLVLGPLFVSQLVPALALAFERSAVEEGRSFLAGRVGSALASPLIHILDDGGQPGALATRAFDDRGVPPAVLPLLREGRVHGLYQGVEEARRREQRPSGHSALGGGLWLGNLIVRPGTRTRNMIFPELKSFVLVEVAVGRLSLDRQTGRLVATVRAFRCEGAAVVGYIGDLRLDCPVEALLQGVVELVSDHERHGIVDSPSWVVVGPTLVPSAP